MNELVALDSDSDGLRVLAINGVYSRDFAPGIQRSIRSASGVVRLFVAGPEVGGSELQNPRDLDATNGQDIYVADGSRVLRFSEEGQLVQTLFIPALTQLGVLEPRDAPPGEAVAVSTGAEGVLFVVESTRGVVQVWRDGQVTDVLGGFCTPVGLAVDGRKLFVADRQKQIVHVLDTAGRPLATMDGAEIGGVTNVSVSSMGVLLLGPRGVLLFSPEAKRLWRVDIESDVPVLGVGVVSGELFALSPNALTFLGKVPDKAP